LQNATLRVVVVGSRGDVDARLADLGADACDVAVEEAIGDPVTLLRQAALTSDLVVVGRHTPTATRPSRLGPVTRALLHDPPCPVLLTPPGHEHGGALGVTTDLESHAG
jgi:nucleotide-binding universal stress UspA family protein